MVFSTLLFIVFAPLFDGRAKRFTFLDSTRIKWRKISLFTSLYHFIHSPSTHWLFLCNSQPTNIRFSYFDNYFLFTQYMHVYEKYFVQQTPVRGINMTGVHK
jgi:hypothetical protein